MPTLSTEDEIRRAIREAIPRDWWLFIDRQFVGETIALIRRDEAEPGHRQPVLFQTTSQHIMPALIESIVAQIKILMAAIQSLVNQTRLATANGLDVDSFGWQLYGDLVARSPLEADDDLRARIQCLIKSTFEGVDYHFLPSPTEDGIAAFLACFGFQVLIPSRTTKNTMLHAHYWNRGSTFSWNRGTGGWDSASIIVIVRTSGDALKDEEIYSLIRRSKVFGTGVQYIVTASPIF